MNRSNIDTSVPVPLGIDGTSGIFERDIARLIRTRVTQFNIRTCLRRAFGTGLREPPATRN